MTLVAMVHSYNEGGHRYERLLSLSKMVTSQDICDYGVGIPSRFGFLQGRKSTLIRSR